MAEGREQPRDLMKALRESLEVATGRKQTEAGRTLPRPDHDFIPGHPSPDLCNLTACQRPKVQHARDTGTGWPKATPASTLSATAREQSRPEG